MVTMKGVLFLVPTLALLGQLALGQEKTFSNDYLGKAPPSLEAPAEQWLNVKKPLRLKALKGQVVWLEFSFLT